MDSSKVLPLLLIMVVSERSQVQSKPLDFVCDSEARRVMNKVKELQQDLVDCSVAASLPTPIRLPCIKVHTATWAKKSVWQRQAETLLSLGSLVQDVRRAQAQSQPSCGLNLLQRLERSISNYLHVLTQLHSKQGESESTQDPVCLGQASQDLRVVLRHFDRLISGKLEWLIMDMAQNC